MVFKLGGLWFAYIYIYIDHSSGPPMNYLLVAVAMSQGQ